MSLLPRVLDAVLFIVTWSGPFLYILTTLNNNGNKIIYFGVPIFYVALFLGRVLADKTEADELATLMVIPFSAILLVFILRFIRPKVVARAVFLVALLPTIFSTIVLITASFLNIATFFYGEKIEFD